MTTNNDNTAKDHGHIGIGMQQYILVFRKE